MANKYITVLLIVLATAGAEAQTIASVAMVAKDCKSIEEICQKSELYGLENDILSFIETYKNICIENEPSLCKKISNEALLDIYNHTIICFTTTKYYYKKSLFDRIFGKSINIRAPNITYL